MTILLVIDAIFSTEIATEITPISQRRSSINSIVDGIHIRILYAIINAFAAICIWGVDNIDSVAIIYITQILFLPLGISRWPRFLLSDGLKCFWLLIWGFISRFCWQCDVDIAEQLFSRWQPHRIVTCLLLHLVLALAYYLCNARYGPPNLIVQILNIRFRLQLLCLLPPISLLFLICYHIWISLIEYLLKSCLSLDLIIETDSFVLNCLRELFLLAVWWLWVLAKGWE